mmetsp:Transcript_21110/g.50931  ORF Transcript_21110/g.50931 Transcript_21110/m.50931 type:complete len:472 (-) Transcript_21110:455-1870(-)
MRMSFSEKAITSATDRPASTPATSFGNALALSRRATVEMARSAASREPASADAAPSSPVSSAHSPSITPPSTSCRHPFSPPFGYLASSRAQQPDSSVPSAETDTSSFECVARSSLARRGAGGRPGTAARIARRKHSRGCVASGSRSWSGLRAASEAREAARSVQISATSAVRSGMSPARALTAAAAAECAEYSGWHSRRARKATRLGRSLKPSNGSRSEMSTASARSRSCRSVTVPEMASCPQSGSRCDPAPSSCGRTLASVSFLEAPASAVARRTRRRSARIASPRSVAFFSAVWVSLTSGAHISPAAPRASVDLSASESASSAVARTRSLGPSRTLAKSFWHSGVGSPVRRVIVPSSRSAMHLVSSFASLSVSWTTGEQRSAARETIPDPLERRRSAWRASKGPCRSCQFLSWPWVPLPCSTFSSPWPSSTSTEVSVLCTASARTTARQSARNLSVVIRSQTTGESWST